MPVVQEMHAWSVMIFFHVSGACDHWPRWLQASNNKIEHTAIQHQPQSQCRPALVLYRTAFPFHMHVKYFIPFLIIDKTEVVCDAAGDTFAGKGPRQVYDLHGALAGDRPRVDDGGQRAVPVELLHPGLYTV